ncbi:MAG: PAS domain-containing protein [Ignavibacteriales bacterium]|nr:MAG: PAS domain-containing protein [Ignavibacteriales bacterium]
MRSNTAYSRILLKAQKYISEGILILDAESKRHSVLYINKGIKKITGLNNTEIIGHGFKTFLSKENKVESVKKILNALEQKINCMVDLFINKKNHQVCFCRISVAYIPGSGKGDNYYLLIVRDITEIRQNLINSTQLDIINTTLRSVNDIVFNFMQGLLLFRTECEVECSAPNVNFKLFDSNYKTTVNRLMKINKMSEYKIRNVGNLGNISILDTGLN